jgi:hypothetical protein
VGFNLGHFFEAAISTVGRGLTNLGSAVYKAAIVPITVPAKIIDDIAHHKSFSKSLYDGFKVGLAAAHDIAPYVQSVIAFIPGLGTAASAAIAGGIALAEGKPIDVILEKTIEGAIPGGAFVGSAYDMGKAAIEHKDPLSVIESGLGGLTSALGGIVPGVDVSDIIPDSAKDLLTQGIQEAKDVVAGTGIDTGAIEQAISQIKIPKDAQKAFLAALKTGMAVGHAKKLQADHCAAVLAPDTISMLMKASAALMKDPVIAAARNALSGIGTHGFDLGIALMHAQNVKPFTLHCMRGSLDVHDQAGFDTALALHIGRATTTPVANVSPAAQAGNAIAQGLAKAPEDTVSKTSGVLKSSPGLQEGAQIAAATSGVRKFVLSAIGLVAGGVLGGMFGALMAGAAVGAGIGYTFGGLGATAQRLKSLVKT